MSVTVIIPTYNPHIGRLQKVIDAIEKQLGALMDSECLIIDNNSPSPFTDLITISDKFRLVYEPKQGLTHARLKGISEAKNDIIVMVDDDNVLGEEYLSYTISTFESSPMLGAIGGKSLPIFETNPEPFVEEFHSLLALRDLGEEIVIVKSYNNTYPSCAPIGAGMAFRRNAITNYVKKISVATNIISDRSGSSLSSSGDNDMVLEILKANWSVGYFPKLVLHHIIPQNRTTKEYLALLNFSIQKSWMQFLLSHGISSWERIPHYTLVLRKLRAWLRFKAWKDTASYIRWRGACGIFTGLCRFDEEN